ncbi:MAG: rRNA pseudouridine synthase [Clostridia bacterium]|nr:rRNA pseudouridine synthase [Clostridia bacterium]
MRIHKFLAECGVASRRASEKMVRDGRVFVNGSASVIGQDIDETNDIITVDGKIITNTNKKLYIMLYKPTEVVSTSVDDRGRKTVIDLIKHDISQRIFCVGRLDYNTEGLILLTNDGDFANIVTHPKNKISKTYLARVKGGLLTKEDIKILRNGVMLEDGKTAPAKVYVEDVYNDNTSLVKITICEGRNRQVRRMFDAVNHPVINLKRIEVGGVSLGNLPYGKWRHLTQSEIHKILNN